MTSVPSAVERLFRRSREEVILASRSARRAMLLDMLGVAHRVIPPRDDPPAEHPVDDPVKYAVNHAVEKARSVAETMETAAVVLGADTIVIVDGDVLEKPADEEEAAKYLRRLSGRDHTVITGLALHRTPDGHEVTGHESSRVWFVPLDERTIELYIETREPMDKAGAYGIQGVGALIVERVEGCYFNVVGLPLARLRRMIQELEEADL